MWLNMSDQLSYLLDAVKTAFSQPRRALKLSYLEAHYGLRLLNRKYHSYTGAPDGFNLIERDWDTAIILDACRHDIFESVYSGSGELQCETAPGSTSLEFITQTFEDRSLQDTVYVTANPHVTILPEGVFHAVELDGSWNEPGAPPERITEEAIAAHEKYPNKRIIVHYMTPHYPFIADGYTYLNEHINYWRKMYYPNGVSRQEIRDGYRANVRVALDHVEKLQSNISGKTIVTSDHGEMLGERQSPIPVWSYGHLAKMYVPELIEVPWLELPYETRRKVVSDPPLETMNIDEESKEERLEALGYL